MPVGQMAEALDANWNVLRRLRCAAWPCQESINSKRTRAAFSNDGQSGAPLGHMATTKRR
jgi:hypothetical protein